ncbi:TPA: hypothetical protein ACPZUA_003878 [Yersinia enterocolitica]
MSKFYQSAVIFLLVFIVMKLYPELSDYAGFSAWIIFSLVAIGGVIVCFLWFIGFIGDWIKNRSRRAMERKEIKEISKTLKEIDRMNKGR